jgi:hypothetical protein
VRVITFYTKDTPYEEESTDWLNSFKQANTACYVMENQKSWEKNCALKSIVLQRALTDHTDHDLLFVDIDARMMRRWDDSEFDELTKNKIPGLAWHPVSGELLSGTIFIPNNEAGHSLINRWVSYQAVNPTMWDQQVLQYFVQKEEVEHFKLPYEWISVDGHISVDDPIIHHYQASRKNKGIVNAHNRILQ